MRRWVITVTIVLLLGAVANVAVAWVSASRPIVMVGDEPQASTSLPDRVWLASRYDRLAATRIYSGVVPEHFEAPRKNAASLLPSWSRLARSVPDSELYFVLEDGYGWPMISMSCAWDKRYQRHVSGGVSTLGWRIRSGIELQPPDTMSPSTASALPIRPVWSGSAANTLFYAVAFWLLFVGPFELRRFMRRSRGLCPTCAYPIGKSDVCSECGGCLAQRAVV